MKSTFEHENWMGLALEQARIAASKQEVPVGAVLIKDGNCIAAGHNLSVTKQDPTAHAELLALQEGLTRLEGRLEGCTLYVTLEPCAMCAGAMINAKLPRLVFGAYDANAGCCGSLLDLTEQSPLFSMEVWGGVLEEDCGAILKEFFRSLR